MKKEYKGYFRKGWILYTAIILFTFLGIVGFIFFGRDLGGTEGLVIAICGAGATTLTGSLMRVILSYDYLNSGEQRLWKARWGNEMDF